MLPFLLWAIMLLMGLDLWNPRGKRNYSGDDKRFANQNANADAKANDVEKKHVTKFEIDNGKTEVNKSKLVVEMK